MPSPFDQNSAVTMSYSEEINLTLPYNTSLIYLPTPSHSTSSDPSFSAFPVNSKHTIMMLTNPNNK